MVLPKRYLILLLLCTPAWAQWFSGITATAGATSCTITWTSAAATQGRVKYGLTTSYGSQTALETVYNLNHSATFSGITSSTLYDFSVVGRDSTGVTVASKNQTCATTSGTAHSVTLNWQASTTPGVTYNVYRSLTSGSGYSQISSGITALTYLDSAVSSGTTYYYVATAFDGVNESSYSNEAQAIIP